MTVLLLPEQVAERVHLSRSTLAKMRCRGDGPPHVRLGGKILYPEDKLEAWVSALPLRTSTATPGPHPIRRGRSRLRP